MIGTTLGHYRLISTVGRGGMGEVFLAEDTTLKRRVAIKRLSEDLPDLPRWLRRLRREAEALAAINHPNVITVHAVEEVDGIPFVVMEFVEGSTVADLIPADGLPASRFFELAIPITAAIAAAHARGVVHGDLKPGNVMVSVEDRVKVLDFGLARVANAGGHVDRTSTVQGGIMGTVPYMALEQLVGEPADRRSDLYALGAMLFEMATGHLPFTGRTVADLARKLATEPPPDPIRERSDLPARLGRLIVQMLDRDPGRRPAGAVQVLRELEACARDTGPEGAAESTATSRPARPVDIEVVQLVARGRHLWNRRSEESLRMAVSCFQQAIDRDPLHAPAWIGLADALNILSNYGFVRPADSRSRIMAAVEKATSLGGETGDSLRALALAAWQLDFDWDRADRLYRRAIELDDESSLSHYWYGVLLAVTGRFDACFAELQRAEQIDPLSLIAPAARGWFTLFSGNAGEGHRMLRRVLSLDPQLHPALWFDGQALTALGRHDEAIASLSEAIRIGGKTNRMLGYLGYACGRAGREESARSVLGELRTGAGERYVPPYFEALVLCGLGEQDEALDALESAWKAKDTMLRDLAVDPPWWELRDRERYRALVAQMGLSLPDLRSD